MNENGLLLKYFVLKPKGNNIYAKASRAAMLVYADVIGSENHNFAKGICKWIKEIEEEIE